MRFADRLGLILLALAVVSFACLPVLAQPTQPAAETPTLREAPPAEEPASAQADKPDQGAAPEEGQVPEKQPPRQWWQGNMIFFVMIGGVVLLYVWMGRSRRKQDAKRREMLGNLKKGEKVVTIGGILGTVIEVKEDEVTVKVDETNNVRMKFLRKAIQSVGEDAKADTDARK